MLPANLLDSLKALVLARKPLLPAVAEATTQTAQFEPGKKYEGSVQAQVSPGIFNVRIANQLIQMQLPSSIRSGDMVALQVIATQPRLTFSMVNSANPLSTPEQLGSTALLLSSMSQQAPEKAYVRAAQSAPLWDKPQPPESKQLSGLLREALGNSGLFYESHQAQWVEGTRSTAQLLQEPQNLTPEQAKAVVAGNAAVRAAMESDASGKIAMASAVSGKTPMAGDTPGKAAMASDAPVKIAMANDTYGKTAIVSDTYGKAAMASDLYGKSAMMSDTANLPVTTNNAASTSASNQPDTPLLQEGKALGIPDHLQPLVQQQLNALETRQMVWQGNVWPEQSMQWEVHEQASQNPGAEEQRQWITQLRLDLPKLGEVAATLRFNSTGLSLTLNAGTPETRAMLGNASTQLVSALSDVGIPVVSTQVTTI